MSIPDLVEQLDRLMRKVDAEMHRLMQSVDDADIGPLGTITLQRLSRIAPTPAHALVEAMGRDASQVSRVIGRLEARQLVSKTMHPADKRLSILTLTETGKAHVDKVDATLETIVAGVFEPLSQDEHAQLLTMLKKLTRG
ncbi:MAG: MarR family transcriptional regulator [Pseudomonadota bacterium]